MQISAFVLSGRAALARRLAQEVAGGSRLLKWVLKNSCRVRIMVGLILF